MRKPTQKMIETFWKVQRYFWTEDAQWQAERFLEWHEEYKPFEEIKNKIDYEYLAGVFEDKYDCDQADNDIWDTICYNYFKDNEDIFGV